MLTVNSVVYMGWVPLPPVRICWICSMGFLRSHIDPANFTNKYPLRCESSYLSIPMGVLGEDPLFVPNWSRHRQIDVVAGSDRHF